MTISEFSEVKDKRSQDYSRKASIGHRRLVCHSLFLLVTAVPVMQL